MAKQLKRGDIDGRLPPGQVLTVKFPVLSYGATPRIDLAKWDLRLFGTVEETIRLTYREVRAMPMSRQVSDFHCVTTWSRLDNVWEGVKTTDLVQRVRLKPETSHVSLICEGGYDTNLTLADFLDETVMLAYRHDGAELHPDHGGPLRLIVPKLYGWKSAKWLRAIEFMSSDRRGFWELRGYHNRGNPWAEERYSFQEDSEE